MIHATPWRTPCGGAAEGRAGRREGGREENQYTQTTAQYYIIRILGNINKGVSNLY